MSLEQSETSFENEVRKPPRLWRRMIPLLGSALLLAAVLWQISPAEVFRAFGRLNWSVLAPTTVLLVLALYLWDSLCLWWLFGRRDGAISYRLVLRARGTSYLFTVINYGLGHGMLAWLLARYREKPFLATAIRCVMITYVDLAVLLTLGMLGGSLSTDPRTDGIAWFCGVGLLLLISFTVTMRVLPQRTAEKIIASRWGQALHSPDWRWRNLIPLALLRTIYASLGLLYVAICLTASGFAFEPIVVLSVIPIVVLVDALPISVSGLGTREAALLLLLRPEEPSLLLAFSLVWWACIVSGRALIGLANVWLPTLMRRR